MNVRFHGICHAVIYISIGFIFTNCLDTIELDLPNGVDQRIVIEGSVQRADQYVINVHVHYTIQNEDVVQIDLQDVVISLLVDGTPVMNLQNGTSIQIPTDEFHQTFGGDLQSKFSIEVRLADGTTYQSTAMPIKTGPESGALMVELKQRDVVNEVGNIVSNDVIEVFINTGLKNREGEKVSMRWDLFGTFLYREVQCVALPVPFDPRSCYVDVPHVSNQISVLVASEISSDRVEGFKVGTVELDYKFNRAYYFTVVQRTLSEEVAKYWDMIAANNQHDGSIFDVPAGQIASNIKMESDPSVSVLGGFYTASVDTLRYKVNGADVNFPAHRCEFIFDAIKPDFCCDCPSEYGAETLRRPDYWED